MRSVSQGTRCVAPTAQCQHESSLCLFFCVCHSQQWVISVSLGSSAAMRQCDSFQCFRLGFARRDLCMLIGSVCQAREHMPVSFSRGVFCTAVV
jgi:hypothetical protein